MEKCAIFITYRLKSNNYSEFIHCNYIKRKEVDLDTVLLNEINFNFKINSNNFWFASSEGVNINGVEILVQIVEPDDNGKFKPISNEWRVYDVTSQVNPFSVDNIKTKIFKISLSDYDSKLKYDLKYLDYPDEMDGLSFGAETIFLGNVETQIKADVFTFDLIIDLPSDEFNSSTNSTWDKESEVFISEIGIYDDDKNLVAIGKLNNPISKSYSISRTIQFSVDF